MGVTTYMAVEVLDDDGTWILVNEYHEGWHKGELDIISPGYDGRDIAKLLLKHANPGIPFGSIIKPHLYGNKCYHWLPFNQSHRINRDPFDWKKEARKVMQKRRENFGLPEYADEDIRIIWWWS